MNRILVNTNFLEFDRLYNASLNTSHFVYNLDVKKNYFDETIYLFFSY